MIKLTILNTPKRRRIIWALAFLFIFIAITPFGNQDAVQYIERTSGQLKTEKIAGEAWLRWLYQNPVGEATLSTLVKRKFVSEWYGNMMDSPDSKDKIASFVDEYQIDLSQAEKQYFKSFNDFFTRKLKPEFRPVNQDRNVVVSPGDGKLLAFADISNQDFFVKGYRFQLGEFLQNDSLTNVFQHGSLMILRLCPTDYHRYHFPVGGEVIGERKIDGDYYSVSPIALRKKIELLVQNKREYAVINTAEFGSVLMSEVGATLVGSMVNTYPSNFVIKREERGYFKFGGSTIVLIFQKDKLVIDADLIQNTISGLETEVKMGERIAIKTTSFCSRN